MNRKTFVGSYASYSSGTCRVGAIPQMKVRQKPKHGKVTFRQITRKLGKGAGRCAGESVKATAVYYTPNRGYRGEDSFSAGYSMPRWTGSAQTKNITDFFIITVK
jgi:hypothetical protein